MWAGTTIERVSAFGGGAINAADSSTRPAARRSWLAGVAASLLAASILLAPLAEGVPKAYDLRDHLGATAQVLKSFQAGELYPRWLPEFHDGFGEPTLVFYPPGLYFVSAPLAAVFGGDILLGLFATVALFAFAGSLGAFVFVRRRFGTAAGALAALAFALMPYRIFEVYAAGLYSAFAAASLVPWALAALEDCVEDGPPSAKLTGRAAWPVLFAAIVLMNLPTAVLLAYLVAVWLAVRAVMNRNLRGVLRVAAGGLWGSLIAGVYMIPAVAETPAVQVPHLGSGMYRNNFLFQPGGSAMSAGLQSVFDRMGLVPALVLAASLGLFEAARQRRDVPAGDARRGWAGLLAVMGFVSLWLATPLSRPAWDFLPVLQRVNLPWRLLEPLSLAAACAAGAAAVSIARGGALPRTVRLAVAALLLGLAAAGLVFDWSLSAANGKLSAADARAGVPVFARKEGYFLPKGARPAAQLPGVPPLACDRPCRAAVLEESPARRRFHLEAAAPMHLAVRTYFFPGWTARRVDARSTLPLPIGAEPGTGRIVLEVPAGDSIVELRFGSTPVRRAGGAVSLLALLGWAMWLKIRTGARARRHGPVPSRLG